MVSNNCPICTKILTSIFKCCSHKFIIMMACFRTFHIILENESLKDTLVVISRTVCRGKTFPIMNLSHSALNTDRSKRTKLITPCTFFHILLQIISFNSIFHSLMLYLHLALRLCILVRTHFN